VTKNDVPRAVIGRASVNARSKQQAGAAKQHRKQVPLHDKPSVGIHSVIVVKQYGWSRHPPIDSHQTLLLNALITLADLY
jgi:hypothetical protein